MILTNNETVRIVCAGCSTIYKTIEELMGNEKKVCPACEYHLFMFSSENVDYDQKELTLNPKQREIIAYLKELFDEKKPLPTMQQLKTKLEFKSISALYYHFNILKEKGFIAFKQGRIHSLQLLPKSFLCESLISISEKQIHILAEIYSFMCKKQQSPTIEELQENSDIRSLATMSYHLNKLEELELIFKKKYRHRSIAITDKGVKILDSLSQMREVSI